MHIRNVRKPITSALYTVVQLILRRPMKMERVVPVKISIKFFKRSRDIKKCNEPHKCSAVKSYLKVNVQDVLLAIKQYTHYGGEHVCFVVVGVVICVGVVGVCVWIISMLVIMLITVIMVV